MGHRILAKSETIEGETHRETYRYDAADHQTAVTHDGEQTAFDYDPNGNASSSMAKSSAQRMTGTASAPGRGTRGGLLAESG